MFHSEYGKGKIFQDKRVLRAKEQQCRRERCCMFGRAGEKREMDIVSIIDWGQI